MDNENDSDDVHAGFSSGFDAVAGYRFPTRHAGIAVYIGLDDATAAAAGTDVRRVAELIASVVDRVAPGAEREVSVIPAPASPTGSNLDIVRRSAASAEPAERVALAPAPQLDAPAARVAPIWRLRPRTAAVVIDVSRHRITVDDRAVAVTFTEFELLRVLVKAEGEPLSRDELLRRLPAAGGPRNERAVDDLVRRLRHKLEPHDDVIRTVRGVGYGFHAHDAVEVRQDRGTSGAGGGKA